MVRLTRRGRHVRAVLVGLAGVTAIWLVAVAVSGDEPGPRPAAVDTREPRTVDPRPSRSVPLSGYDVVILGGRVMDPETRFDRVANVGIKGGTVRAVTDEPIRGRRTIRARGLVVAPGFIDNLSYEPNSFGIWYKIADGVTTTLGMHGINSDARSFLSQRGVPVHFGGAFDGPYWRSRLGIGAFQQPTAAQVRRLASLADDELRNGWVGIDVEPEYSPGTSYREILALAKVAARHKMPVYFHARYSDVEPPGTNFDALREIIRIGKESGAAVHVEHINSTGGTFSMKRSLDLLEQARRDGVDVTACIYPYNFWSTFLASARFAPGWQERFRIGYSDLEVPATGERLTRESFERYRRQNRVVVAHAIPEEDVRTALRSPLVMMGSDTILVPNEGRHPRGAGSFARLLGKYVREEKVLSLMDALAKMTLMPAQRVEAGAPAMRKKGRLQVGSDADITIFDPRTVRDRATVARPAQFSEGIEWVLVMGKVAKDPKGVRKTVLAGRPIRSAVKGGREAALAPAVPSPPGAPSRPRAPERPALPVAAAAAVIAAIPAAVPRRRSRC